MAADAGEVTVLEDVAGAVDAGPLAVPHAEDAVVPGAREQVGELAAINRGGAQVLVDPGDEDDVVIAQEVGVALEGEVEPTQGGAAITRDQRRGVEAAASVGPVLFQRQPDQRLDAGQEDGPVFLPIFGVETETGRGGDRHCPYDTGAFARAQITSREVA